MPYICIIVSTAELWFTLQVKKLSKFPCKCMVVCLVIPFVVQTVTIFTRLSL